MEQNKKWYAVRTVLEHLNEKNWKILDRSGDNILSPTDVGEEEAEENAKLCAAASEMRQLLGKLHWWLSAMLKNYPQHEEHSVYKLLEECEELIKQTTHEY